MPQCTSAGIRLPWVSIPNSERQMGTDMSVAEIDDAPVRDAEAAPAPAGLPCPDTTGLTSYEWRWPLLRFKAWVPVPEERTDFPLVVVMHGCTQVIDCIDDEAGWFARAREHRFAVLFVEEPNAGNRSPLLPGLVMDPNCFDWFRPEDAVAGVGQPGEIVAAVKHLAGLVNPDTTLPANIDLTRVYVAGFSAGAGMAALLLATHPQVFAGAAAFGGPVVGLVKSFHTAWAIYWSPYLWLPQTAVLDAVRSVAPAPAGRPASQNPPKIAIWHGRIDAKVSPGHALAQAEQFAHLAGMETYRSDVPKPVKGKGTMVRSAPPYHDGSGRRFERYEYALAGGNAPFLQLNLVPGLGHELPVSYTPTRITGCTHAKTWVSNDGLDSTAEVVAFFGL